MPHLPAKLRIQVCRTAFVAVLFLPGALVSVRGFAAPAAEPAVQRAAAAPEVRGEPAQSALLAKLSGVVRERLQSIDLSAAPGSLPRPSASVAETVVALAAVQVEKARDYLRSPYGGAVAATVALQNAQDLLALDNPEAPPTIVRHDQLVEHAYFARNDGSPQPYFAFVPTSYTPGKPVPLVVFLHGWVPTTCRTDPYLISNFVTDLAEQHGTLFVIPHGRTNTDFQYAGEVDVLRVKAEMERFYSVDPDRVYLLGVSMGGAGAWQVGMHYPDLWAGIAPINGQGDWFRFWHEKFAYPPRAELPGHLQWLIGLNNPIDLCGNLLNTYSYAQHAVRCFLGPVHSREIAAKLAGIGAPHELFEDPSDLGHYIYWRAECWQRAFGKLVAQRRNPLPKRVTYSTYSTRFPGAHWVAIDRIAKWGRLASVDATYDGQGHITATTENVAAMTLSPAPEWAGEKRQFDVVCNGRKAGRHTLGDDGRIHLDLSPAAAGTPAVTAGLNKNRAVCGPAADLLNSPFVVVVGTSGTPEETAANRKLANQFASDWNGYAEGRVRVVRDLDVDDALTAQHGLILCGLPENNKVIAGIADRLPFQISRDTIALPDGKRFATQEVGLILTYPNPLAPQRYILVYNGFAWGAARSNNHKFDFIPDFAVYAPDSVPEVGINRFLAAGLFDERWQYKPELTDFEPAPDKDD